jgi:hypothetical protein
MRPNWKWQAIAHIVVRETFCKNDGIADALNWFSFIWVSKNYNGFDMALNLGA